MVSSVVKRNLVCDYSISRQKSLKLCILLGELKWMLYDKTGIIVFFVDIILVCVQSQ